MLSLRNIMRYACRHPHPCRLLSSSSSPALLEEHVLSVPSFGGSLDMTVHFPLEVRPACAIEHPNMDKVFIKVSGPSTDISPNISTSIKQEGPLVTASSECSSSSLLPHLSCTVELPMVHNLTLASKGQALIDCRDIIESDYCHIVTEDGDVIVGGVKTAELDVSTKGGDVICQGTVQGKIGITTQEGNVRSNKRFLGTSLDITTETGDIEIASCYSEQSKFTTQTGNMVLKNLHNESYIAVYEEGDVRIQGLDGSTNVFVKKGSVDIQVSQIKDESRIHLEEGDIKLRMSDTFATKLCVTADEITLDDKFSQHGSVERKEDNYCHYLGIIHPDKFSPTLQVIAENGRVVLESQSWAASLGLRLPSSGPKAKVG